MIPFFSRTNRDAQLSTPVVFPPKWSYVKTGLQINLEKVQTYSKLYPFAVPSQHFLNRLITSISVPMSVPLERYYDLVDGMAKNLSMSMQMTSPYYRGKVHNGVFYGKGSSEVLLLNEDYFDSTWVHENWRQACPIKVLQHPKSDLGMFVPFGRPYSQETGLSVISINITMLAVMYRAFILQRKSLINGQSPYMFLGGFVLPNMLDSHVDIALFNRYCRVAFDIDDQNNIPSVRHSFTMPDYSALTDFTIAQAVEHAKRQHRNFNTTLKSLPAISQLNMSEVLQMPDTYRTMQDDWALQACRLKAIRFLIHVCGSTAAATDRGQLIKLLRSSSHYNIKDMMEQMLPAELAQEAFNDMALIEHTVGVNY